MSGAEPLPAPPGGELAGAASPAARMAAANTARSNPFSTRYIQPGAIPFFFPSGVDAAQLVSQLAAANWWGEIVGPHGSGKSTLLAALTPRLIAAGRGPLQVTLHNGERSLARHRALLAAASPQSIVMMDGYEQLWPWNRALLRRFCRRRRAGLIVTSHAPTGLPPLYASAIDQRTAAAVLDQLLPAGSPAVAIAARDVWQADLARALAAHGQNLRDALFELYDLYEQRQHAQGG